MILRDSGLKFPHFEVLKASAGSGKTYALARRFVQFILSRSIGHNGLANILAVTFSNNAAKEMKGRILFWLKSITLADERLLDEMSGLVALSREELITRADRIIDEILDDYSRLRVLTIDSFMTEIFKAAAIDMDMPQEFEIEMSNDSIMEYAFNLFLRDVREGSVSGALMDEIFDLIIYESRKGSSPYLWEPAAAILDKVKELYTRLAQSGKGLRYSDMTKDLERIKSLISQGLEELERAVEKSGLERSKKSTFPEILRLVRQKRFPDLLGKGTKTPPVNKPDKKNIAAIPIYEEIVRKWEGFTPSIGEYVRVYAACYYLPYLRVFEAFAEIVERVKKGQERVFIEDINAMLAGYVDEETVPEVYFRIGETIFHYLIDEFQDTSPIQWKNLYPLMENSLSLGGSLFAVGDTKQAIYGFREADYKIMKSCEEVNPFPSASHIVNELDVNYRSMGRILEFNEMVFKEKILNSDHGPAARLSGLSDYIQFPLESNRNKGHAQVTIVDNLNDDENAAVEEETLLIIERLLGRGYDYGDIAVITNKNENVVRITSWLNRRDIPFISYSSLDIRNRKVTGELISLLRFLDSPLDDLAFVSFCLGEIMSEVLTDWHEFFGRNRAVRPLYKAFKKEYPGLWERYFDRLFSLAGYLPLYDLVTEAYHVFDLFERFGEEEAALVKVLEVIKGLEEAGSNSLRDFIEDASGIERGEYTWNIDLPSDASAVQVMTIHKAKGLGFPVCIVILFEAGGRKGVDHVITGDNHHMPIIKVSKVISGYDRDLEEMYRNALTREEVNALNTLYVGFTRPEYELYVIGVQTKGGFPIDILPVESFPAVETGLQRSSKRTAAANSYVTPYYNLVPFKPPAAITQKINLEERRRGEAIHSILRRIDYIDDTKTIDDIVAGNDDYDKGLTGVVTGFLSQESISQYFRRVSGRTVMNEREFIDREGRLFRMDRVVIDNDSVTVIDYKSGAGSEMTEEYRRQIGRYMEILQGIYPKSQIKGLLAFIDTGKTLEVSMV